MVAAPERLDLAAVSEDELSPDRMGLRERNLLLDLSGVEFIDSSGMGWLVGLQKRIRGRNGQLVLVSPSKAVRRALSLMRLEEFFACAQEGFAAMRLLKMVSEKQANAVTLADGSCGSTVGWHGEITAANAEEVWAETLSKLMPERPRLQGTAQCGITVDLADVPFIDSTGLGLLIRMKKMADEQRVSLLFANVHPAVGNVIQLARLETFLFGEKEATEVKG